VFYNATFSGSLITAYHKITKREIFTEQQLV